MLHNMSCRPSTQVEWAILPVGEAIVRFEFEGVDWGAASLSRWRSVTRALQGRTASRSSTRSADVPAELIVLLDDAWREWSLKGAVHVYPWPAAGVVAQAAGLSVFRATHPELVLNVLGRTRSQLLLPSMPLELERPFLERQLATDDPRLVELAVRTAFVEEN